jgi:ABC-type Fe3+/spermidine/putrescine transport system ATPase subunit
MWLSVTQLHKSFGGTVVLRDINFGLQQGETLAILGRSGCGKTTLLKILAGLIEAEGNILLNGASLRAVPPQQRGIVYLYQEALLFPHLNVFENVAFGLRLQKATDVVQRTQTMLAQLGLSDQAQKMPDALSGGQKQRVAFGRALIIQPRLLLLDEPFGALDTETRQQMQEFYRHTASEQGISSIFVTHDLKEALLMGDQWGYMAQGHLDLFDSAAAFSADDRTGVQRERAFWQAMATDPPIPQNPDPAEAIYPS